MTATTRRPAFVYRTQPSTDDRREEPGATGVDGSSVLETSERAASGAAEEPASDPFGSRSVTREPRLPSQAGASGRPDAVGSNAGPRSRPLGPNGTAGEPASAGPGSIEDRRGSSGFETERPSLPESGAPGRRGRAREDVEVPWDDGSVALDADLDRIVERLYRKLERKRRIERERRGF